MGQPRVYGTLLDTPELEQVFFFFNNAVEQQKSYVCVFFIQNLNR